MRVGTYDSDTRQAICNHFPKFIYELTDFTISTKHYGAGNEVRYIGEDIGKKHFSIKKTTKSDLYLCHHEFGCPSVEITFDNTNANGQNCTRFEEGKYDIIQNYINSYYIIIQALSARQVDKL